MALEYNDLIQQNAENGKYRLGIKLFRLGHQAVSHLNLREICRPFLTRIMDETKETVHLAVLDEDQVLYLDKVEGPHALRMPSRVGRRIPTYCTSLGKAMLSCLDDQEVKNIFRDQVLRPYTANTVKTLEPIADGSAYDPQARIFRSITKRSRSACVASARRSGTTPAPWWGRSAWPPRRLVYQLKKFTPSASSS